MNTKTQFTICLAALLDAKSNYTSARWARYLVVSRAAITQWTSGRHVPSPDKLLKLLAKFDEPNDDEQKALDAFQEMADQPIGSVTDQPQKFRGANSVADYVCDYRLQNIATNTQHLPLQARLEAISYYSALTQILDEHFAMPGKRKPAHVLTVLHNMRQFRSVAANFGVLLDGKKQATKGQKGLEDGHVLEEIPKPKTEKLISSAKDIGSLALLHIAKGEATTPAKLPVGRRNAKPTNVVDAKSRRQVKAKAAKIESKSIAARKKPKE